MKEGNNTGAAVGVGGVGQKRQTVDLNTIANFEGGKRHVSESRGGTRA